MNYFRPLAVVLASAPLVLAGTARAGVGVGTVWTVDNKPGASADFTDVQAAIDAAHEGDTIRIAASPIAYTAPAIVGKSLAICGDAGHSAEVVWHGEARISGIAPGQLVALDGLRIDGMPLTWPATPPALSIDTCAGSVWISRCTIVGTLDQTGVRVRSSSAVVLDRAFLQGGFGQQGSPITHTYGGPGAPALELESARASVFGSELRGGFCGEDSVHWQSNPWPCDGGVGGSAARVDAASELVMIGGHAVNGWSKDAYYELGVLQADATSMVRASDVSVSVAAGCTTVVPFLGPHEELALPYRVLLPPPLVLEPPAATLLAKGELLDAVVLLASAGAGALALPGVHGLLHVSAPLFVVGAAALPTSGPAAHAFTLPLAAPTTSGQYASLCFQAGFLDASGAALLANPALVKVPL